MADLFSQGTILMLHSVLPQEVLATRITPRDNIEISTEFLQELLNHCERKGYTFISMDELHTRMENETLHEVGKFIVLTFDDGYCDTYTHAYPILKERDIPFTTYIHVNMINGTPSHFNAIADEWIGKSDFISCNWNDASLSIDCTDKASALKKLIQFIEEYVPEEKLNTFFKRHNIEPESHRLSWDMINEMTSSGLMTIGSHTISHPHLKTLDEKTLIFELEESKRIIEEMTDTKIVHFCYPFGEGGHREKECANKCGYKTITSIREERVNYKNNDLLDLPRMSAIHNSMEMIL